MFVLKVIPIVALVVWLVLFYGERKFPKLQKIVDREMECRNFVMLHTGLAIIGLIIILIELSTVLS